MCAAAGGEVTDAAAAAVRVGSGNDKTTEKGGEARFGGVGAKAVDGPFVFGRRRVGVVKRPSAVEGAGGVGGAGAFGALAAREEEVVVEAEVDITFSLPKPRRKEKKEKRKRKEKATVKAAVDVAEEAAVVVAAKVDEKSEDLEVLSIWSDHIDKTSEETADN